MFPRNFAAHVPPAGIVTQSGESIRGCFRRNDEFQGSDTQWRYRSHQLGEPGGRLHVPGIINPDPPENIRFGIHTPEGAYTFKDCVKLEAEHPTAALNRLEEAREAGYHRSKQKLGQVPDGVAEISPEMMRRGFGIQTRYGESVAAVVQGTHSDIPRDPKLQTGYQTRRNYNWTTMNPVTHTFGIVGTANIDHLNEIMVYDGETKIVETAVDRADHNAILQDPNPLNPKPDIIAHTMRADQLKDTRDPSERPPAGVSTRPGQFTIGDTFAGMGIMDSFDNDWQSKPRDYNPELDVVHGIPTRPNPFPNPLRGPGKYINLGLSDEDFLKLRDKQHIVPVMVTALALSEQEASDIFDAVARREHRNLISVSEFHQEFKKLSNY